MIRLPGEKKEEKSYFIFFKLGLYGKALCWGEGIVFHKSFLNFPNSPHENDILWSQKEAQVNSEATLDPPQLWKKVYMMNTGWQATV